MVEPKQKRRKILKIVIGAILLIAVLSIGLIMGLMLKSKPSLIKEGTTTCQILSSGGISVYEDEKCKTIVKTIDWGTIETNESYQYIIYVRNDAKDWFETKDIVWQRSNINPTSVYFSMKCDYGNKQIEPQSSRRVVVTLTILGILDFSGNLNSNLGTPQFTFDLKLIGMDLNPWGSPAYVDCHATRDNANIIKIVYKDDLKETISVIMQIGVWNGNELNVVWNSTKYTSEFVEKWIEANGKTSYQLIVTMNHERYEQLEYRIYLPRWF